MGDMEIVRQFNSELSTIYETKPPISKAKVASVTRLAVKAIKYYKHVVQSIEKFAQKCRQEYKIPALYVIDSVIRQSRHQFGSEKDVYGPRFAKNLTLTFQHIFKCSPEEQGKVIKVLNLWQKSSIYSPEVIQPLLNLPSSLSEGEMPSTMDAVEEPTEVLPQSVDTSNVNNPLTSALEAQRQEHLQQIQLLEQKLQEQQRINEQQQQQLLQQQQFPTIPGMPVVSGMQLAPQAHQPGYEAPQQSQANTESAVMDATETQGSRVLPSAVGLQQQQPKFQLQPEVFAQIQALTGMNIRMPNQASAPDSVPGPQPSNSVQGANVEAGPPSANQGTAFHDSTNYGAPPGMPVWAPHGIGPTGIAPTQQGFPQEEERRASVIDDFDYGDDDDDASRIAEQRRHLMEEERRLSQESNPRMVEMQGEFQNTFRPVGELPQRHPDPAGPFGRRSPDQHQRERSPGDRYHKSRSPRRRSRSPRWRDRSPRRRSRSPYGRDRDRDRDRDRERGRNRDRDRDWHKDRDSDRDRDKDRGRGSDRETEKRHDWIPVPKKETLSVCSTTIWVGHLGKSVTKENLLEVFEDHKLPVSSIDMVPPRGCAYVVMEHRKEASRGLVVLKNTRMYNNTLKLAWAPGKGVKGKEYKEYFDTEQGVAYIPWKKLGNGVDFQALSDGGWIDPETLPPGTQNTSKEGSEAGSTDTSNTKDEKDLGTMSQEELMKLAAAQASTEGKASEQGPPVNPLSQPPPLAPPPGPHMFPGPHPMVPPPMMIQPPFPGAPVPPNMVPPPNMAGVPPPNMAGPPLHQFNPPGAPPGSVPNGPHGPPPPNLARPPEGGQFPPDNSQFPPSSLPQEGGQFPPRFPNRPQDGAQFPPHDSKFPLVKPEEGGQFPPHHPIDEAHLPPHQPVDQFPPHHPSREGPFPPHHPTRHHEGGPFPPPGRFQGGHFPPMHHGPPPFHQRPPHHMRMPPFHPGGPRFPHDIPPLMPGGGPPRGPDFGPPPWGPGPGPMRGPPPHSIPPSGWPDNRPPEAPEDVRSLDERDNQSQEERPGERPGDKSIMDKGNPMEQAEAERDFPGRQRREQDDGERDRVRDQIWERVRDRDDRGRERDDRARNRDRDDRFRNRDRGRDRERDRDRGRDRDRDRDWEWDRDRGDRRRERENYRPREFNGERDGPRDASRDGPRRRSRFEPLEEKPVPNPSEPILNIVNVRKEERSSEITTSIATQNSQSELAPREEGEIVEGNESESMNVAVENETAHNPKDNGVTNITIATDTPNSSVGSEAANVAHHNKVTAIPMDNEAVNVPGDNFNFSKDNDAENVSLKENNLSSVQSDDASLKLSNQGIKVDGETEQASS